MTKAGLELREGRVEDIDAVLAMERETAEAPHWTRKEYGVIFSSRDGDGSLHRCLMVAATGAQLLGFSVAGVIRADATECWGEVENMAVIHSARRMGIGRALCAALLDWCRQQGATRVHLEVRSGTVGAIALYRSLGFEIKGRRRAYYAHPEDDALLFELDLQ